MIKVLEKAVAERIAAGEIIERPSSVVKELLENSMDSGATFITLKIKEGGKFISVLDNGSGIASDDVKKLFIRHATSKINAFEDLDSLSTFGFRGEALATIASCSNVILTTKTDKENIGNQIRVFEGNVTYKKVSCKTGTSIEVENLFYNMPARRKFLKGESTERAHILEVFENAAISSPETSFYFYSNQKCLKSFENTDIQNRIKEIYPHFDLNFISLQASDNFNLSGALSNPGDLSAGSIQKLFVNFRPIKSNIISKAVQDAYKGFIRSDIRPSFLLFLLIDPSVVDFNVHPRKYEAKFINQSEIYSTIVSSIRNYLSSFSQTQVINNELDNNELDHNLSGASYNQEEVKSYTYSFAPDEAIISNEKSFQQNSESILGIYDFHNKLSPNEEIDPFDRLNENPFFTQDPIFFEKQEEKYPGLRQIEFKFISYSKNDCIYFIDQHGAAERINYEKIIKNLTSSDKFIPLMSENLILNISDIELVGENIETFQKLGIDLSVEGEKVTIEAYSSIYSKQIQNVIQSVIEDIKNETFSNPEELFINRIAASAACRSAIMFGDELSTLQMTSILNSLSECSNPDICAHGRPIVYKIAVKDILKDMGRC